MANGGKSMWSKGFRASTVGWKTRSNRMRRGHRLQHWKMGHLRHQKRGFAVP